MEYWYTWYEKCVTERSVASRTPAGPDHLMSKYLLLRGHNRSKRDKVYTLLPVFIHPWAWAGVEIDNPFVTFFNFLIFIFKLNLNVSARLFPLHCTAAGASQPSLAKAGLRFSFLLPSPSSGHGRAYPPSLLTNEAFFRGCFPPCSLKPTGGHCRRRKSAPCSQAVPGVKGPSFMRTEEFRAQFGTGASAGSWPRLQGFQCFPSWGPALKNKLSP